jgi:hypothetical protein
MWQGLGVQRRRLVTYLEGISTLIIAALTMISELDNTNTSKELAWKIEELLPSKFLFFQWSSLLDDFVHLDVLVSHLAPNSLHRFFSMGEG